ncbi:porin, partial [Roseomonas mucosa]
LFLERSAISNIVAGLATGDSREAVGLEARGRDWNLSLYGTGGTSSALHDHRQRGLAGRAVAVSGEGGLLHLQAGFDVAAQFDPGTVPGNDTLRLRDYPELRGDGSLRFLDTRSMGAQDVYAYGPELSGTIGPLYVEALYQQIVVDRGHGGTSRFDGWYAQAALPLHPWNGKRKRSAETGTWRRPPTEGWAGFNGNPGALELAARYSTVNLNDGTVRGGTQSIWTVGLNWYLSENLKVQTQYQNGRVALDGPDRLFQAWAVRLAFNL